MKYTSELASIMTLVDNCITKLRPEVSVIKSILLGPDAFVGKRRVN